MIKFFRNVRKRLLSEGKTGKYLKYAVGEIVLVVIGILIALQINTWNQGRQASNKEQTYLRNIEVDLKQQLAYINNQLEKELEYDSIAKMLLGHYRTEEVLTIDSTSSRQLFALTIRNTFIKADPTYQDLISTGNISLIKDESLRNELISYYLELARMETIILNNNFLYVDEIFAAKIFDKVYIADSIYIGKEDQRLLDISNQLLQDPEHKMQLINLIYMRGDLAKGHIQFMNELKGKTESILHSVERYDKIL